MGSGTEAGALKPFAVGWNPLTARFEDVLGCEGGAWGKANCEIGIGRGAITGNWLPLAERATWPATPFPEGMPL